MIRSYLNDAKCPQWKWDKIFNHKTADNQPPIEDIGSKKESDTRQKEETCLEIDSVVKENEVPLTNEKDSQGCKNSAANN